MDAMSTRAQECRTVVRSAASLMPPVPAPGVVAARRSRGLSATLAVLGLCAVLGCSAQPHAEVSDFVDEALAGLEQGYYANTPEWEAAVEREKPALQAAQSVEATYPILVRLTKVAGGDHSFFSNPEEVAGTKARYPGGKVPVPTVAYDGELAVLAIPAFSSIHQEEIRHFLHASEQVFSDDAAESACGWVIDLRANTGGDMRTMLVSLSPLLDEGTVMTFRDRDGTKTHVVNENRGITWNGERWGELADPTPGLSGKPIALVQSSATASAGEALILAFRGQDRVETFGEVTSGYTTVNKGVYLSDGSTITLSFALMGDRSESFPEGPLEPDQAVTGSYDAPLQAAKEWASQQCAVQ